MSVAAGETTLGGDFHAALINARIILECYFEEFSKKHLREDFQADEDFRGGVERGGGRNSEIESQSRADKFSGFLRFREPRRLFLTLTWIL